MKKINREQLLCDLQSLKPGTSAKEVIEQSSCLVFKDGYIQTFNDEISCKIKTDIGITAAIKADPIIDLLDKLQEEFVELRIKNEELIVIGKSRKAGITLQSDVTLPVDEIEAPGKWKKLPEDFTEAVSIAQDCAGTDETQFKTTCVHLTPDFIEACDNYQAARYAVKIPISKNTLVRKKTIKQVVDQGMDEISETEDWLHFKNKSGLVMSCRRYFDDYQDLSPLFEVKGTKTRLPEGIVDAAEKARIFSGENTESDQVTIFLDTNSVKIEGRGVSGWYKETKEVKYSGKAMSFCISPDLLANIVQNYKSCKISRKPRRLKASGANFQYVTALTALDE